MKKTERFKYTVKVLLSYFLYYAGILHVYKRIRLKNKAVVLMYHRVLPSEMRSKSFSHDGIIVEETTFEMHMQFLKDNYNVISLNEFMHCIEKKTPFQDYSCLITFDDGWQDNYQYAYPILNSYGLPALIFLTVNYIATTGQFWQERLSELLFNIHRLSAEQPAMNANYHELLKKHNFEQILTVSEENLRSSIQEMVTQCKQHSYADIGNIIADLSEVLTNMTGSSNNPDRFMNWVEIKEMIDGGISFGSHTMNHKILTKIPADETEREIAESKHHIKLHLKREVDAFSYPNGNYNREIAERVKSHGYAVAFGTENGFVACSDDPFTFKRINIHEGAASNIPMFMTRILGIF